MRDVRISVEIEIRRSANYSWDQAMCQVSATLDADEGIDDIADWLLDRATRTVERRLGQSASLDVRRTMVRKPRLCNECHEPLGDDEDYLHPACEELQKERRAQQRAEQEARWAQEREERAHERDLVGVTAQDHEFADDMEREEADEDEDIPL